ncbi:MAG: hypothetical protein M3Z67_03970, partial [Commensalibacter sp.]|nr:hypothetical protein [Commensalibacter sp.]
MYKKISLLIFGFLLLLGLLIHYRSQIRDQQKAEEALQSGIMHLNQGKKYDAMGDFSYLTSRFIEKNNDNVGRIV